MVKIKNKNENSNIKHPYCNTCDGNAESCKSLSKGSTGGFTYTKCNIHYYVFDYKKIENDTKETK